MMKIFYFLMICFLVTGYCNDQIHKDYLEGRIGCSDKRRYTFEACLHLLEQRNAKCLVETGTARSGLYSCEGDGCSTIIWGDWAYNHGAELFSIDIDPGAVERAKEAVRPFNPNVRFYARDSIGFLHKFKRKIDFLYLDSYDFDYNNPAPSQKHHLAEINAAFPFLHEQSVVMIDDCDLPYGGKGKLVIEFLQERGWEIYLRGYQVIMVKSSSL